MLKRDRYHFSAAGLLLATIAIFDARAALAKIMILSSNAKILKVNTDLQDNERLKVPAGKRVKIMLPSGTTAVVKGPADLPVTELEKGHTLIKPLWSKVKSYLSEKESLKTTKPKDPRELAARSNDLVVSRALLSWSLIPIPTNTDGAICVLKDAPLSFERSSFTPPPIGDKQTSMKLSGSKAVLGKTVVIQWKPKARKVSWPSRVIILDGGQYYAEPNFTGPSQIKLKLVDKAGVDGNQVLPVLYSKGCFDQIKAWVLAVQP